ALERFGRDVLVVGNSLGGCVALRLAEQQGAGVAGVAALAPAGLHVPRWVVIVERDPVIRFLLASPIPLSGALVQRAVGALYRRLAFCEPRRIDPRVARTFASHIGTKAHVARIVELLQRLLPELREPLRFEAIAPPVLLVWGD